MLLLQGQYYKETPLVVETINFTIESLAFQDRHLNGALSISDIKRSWLSIKIYKIVLL